MNRKAVCLLRVLALSLRCAPTDFCDATTVTEHTTKLGRALAPAATQLGGVVRAELVNLVSIIEGNGSRALVDFVRRIAESSSASEETSIVADELQRARDELVHENALSETTLREILLRLVFCELLGHAAPFAHIVAMRLAASSNLRCKQVGYLACRLFMRRTDSVVRAARGEARRALSSRGRSDDRRC